MCVGMAGPTGTGSVVTDQVCLRRRHRGLAEGSIEDIAAAVDDVPVSPVLNLTMQGCTSTLARTHPKPAPPLP